MAPKLHKICENRKYSLYIFGFLAKKMYLCSRFHELEA